MELEKLSVSGRMKKVSFRDQIITFQEKTAIEDLENAIGIPVGPNDRPVHRDIGLIIENEHVIELELSQKGYTSKTFPNTIGYLKWLKKINLGWNDKLTNLPEEIGNLESIEIMYLNYCELTELPSSFSTLINLRFLSLYMNYIEALPDTFGDLITLEELDLGNNSLKRLPQSFGNLANLRKLNLKASRMPKLPKSFINLKSIKEITIGEYQVKYFPNQVAKKLKKQGCQINYTERGWVGGPGGNSVTEHRSL